MRTRPAARSGWFSTVWSCGQVEHPAGIGLLSGWLLTAVVKVVTCYSLPGDRIALVEPVDVGGRRRRGGDSGGLWEAAWSVIRLGRGVRTATIGGDDRSGSGLGRDALGGLFDVVIVAGDPRVLAVARSTVWGRVLTPTGVLAVITHVDVGGRWMCDPAGGLVRAASADGLGYVDHIVLLRTPVGVSRPVSVDGATRVRAHADLHVFRRREFVGMPPSGDVG